MLNIKLIGIGTVKSESDPVTDEAIRFSGLILRGVALGVGYWIVGRVLPQVTAAQRLRQRRR